ncbi:HAMP domain-containing histidine kinase [Microtetraspora sp. AC03309]|uniref:sensor histidine kinase n=1 Tax=Microtetraspora sp. AC03309 TaxID=2779376 RepID=UPI001E58E752|nr:HAMP domain-containing sensor histidine kinase [Microtetraspora sp. AC03309]MCC5576353.1 HAMP domain-containing histidine kinase [Microtetraspora sp. AC03309]
MIRLLSQQRQFVADASHELLTPIAGLRAQLEEARLHPGEGDLDEVLGRALRDIDRLQTIVHDLLVLARVGTAPPEEWSRVDLAELVRDEVSMREDGIPVRLLLSPGLVFHVVADEFRRVVRNLLDNAQRHASRTVRVEVRRNGRYAELIVTDDGRGIASADRDRIFERFSRLDTARCRDHGGSGLGLAIVRAVAHAHSGTVEVADSAAGACFILRLPFPGEGR